MRGCHFIIFPGVFESRSFYILRENFSHFEESPDIIGGQVVLKNGTKLRTSLDMIGFNFAFLSSLSQLTKRLEKEAAHDPQ